LYVEARAPVAGAQHGAVVAHDPDLAGAVGPHRAQGGAAERARRTFVPGLAVVGRAQDEPGGTDRDQRAGDVAPQGVGGAARGQEGTPREGRAPVAGYDEAGALLLVDGPAAEREGRDAVDRALVGRVEGAEAWP